MAGIQVTFIGDSREEVDALIREYLGEEASGAAPAASSSKSKSSGGSAKTKKEPKINHDTIREAMTAVEGKAAQKKAILADYGVKSISDLAEEDLPEVHQKVLDLND